MELDRADDDDAIMRYVAEKCPHTTRVNCSLTHVFAREVADRPDLHHSLWHETAKQALFNVWQLFNGQLQDPSADQGLVMPYRLSAAQRDQAQEHFLGLWDIIMAKRLERTPAATARADQAFQRFLQAATTKPKRRRRG